VVFGEVAETAVGLNGFAEGSVRSW
jgi:hypothetical protein